MKGATISRVAQFASLAFLVLSNLQGQVERASLAGTVTDSSGAVIPGVTIKVINEGTNTAVNLETDAAGEFRAVNLTPAATRLTPRSRVSSGMCRRAWCCRLLRKRGSMSGFKSAVLNRRWR